MSPIPTAAFDSLLMAVEEATTLALEGNPAAGYEVLLVGRARTLEGERNFEPWAEPRQRGGRIPTPTKVSAARSHPRVGRHHRLPRRASSSPLRRLPRRGPALSTSVHPR